MHSKLLQVMNENKFWQNHKLVWLSETKSTNDDLKSMWRLSEFYHCLEVADCQSNGKGQYERKWVSSLAGQCLMFSFSVHVKQYDFPVSMIAGAALAVALGRIGLKKDDFWLKWPNDIWVKDRKLVGILTESMCALDGFKCVVGIGLNMKPVFVEGKTKAASLEEEGITLDRDSVLCEFCKAWNEVFYMSSDKQMSLWNEYGGQFWKREFIFDIPGKQSFSGVPILLESDGTLRVKNGDKEEKVIAASLLPI